MALAKIYGVQIRSALSSSATGRMKLREAIISLALSFSLLFHGTSSAYRTGDALPMLIRTRTSKTAATVAAQNDDDAPPSVLRTDVEEEEEQLEALRLHVPRFGTPTSAWMDVRPPTPSSSSGGGSGGGSSMSFSFDHGASVTPWFAVFDEGNRRALEEITVTFVYERGGRGGRWSRSSGGGGGGGAIRSVRSIGRYVDIPSAADADDPAPSEEARQPEKRAKFRVHYVWEEEGGSEDLAGAMFVMFGVLLTASLATLVDACRGGGVDRDYGYIEEKSSYGERRRTSSGDFRGPSSKRE